MSHQKHLLVWLQQRLGNKSICLKIFPLPACGLVCQCFFLSFINFKSLSDSSFYADQRGKEQDEKAQ